MNPVTGKIISITFFPGSESDIQATIELDGHDNDFILLGGGTWIADSVSKSIADLAAWMLRSSGPITCTLHPDPMRYNGVIKGEFSR